MTGEKLDMQQEQRGGLVVAFLGIVAVMVGLVAAFVVCGMFGGGQ